MIDCILLAGMMIIDVKDHGVWWNIAGAGWVSELPAHHEQLELFGGCPAWSRHHLPHYGGPALAFTKHEAEQLAIQWSQCRRGPYVALPLGTQLPKGRLTFDV